MISKIVVELLSRDEREIVIDKLPTLTQRCMDVNKEIKIVRARTQIQLQRNTALIRALDAIKKSSQGNGKARSTLAKRTHLNTEALCQEEGITSNMYLICRSLSAHHAH